MRLTVFTAYYHLHAFALSPRVIHQRASAMAHAEQNEGGKKVRVWDSRRFREGKITLVRSRRRRVGVRQ